MNRWFLIASIAIALLCGAPRTATAQRSGGAQPVAVTSASISGVVTDRNGAPVRGARVTLSARERGGQRSVATDQRGAFHFAALAAGRYVITARKDSFLSAVYGARSPGRPGTPIALAAGQKLERINLSLARGGVIAGSILDPDGEPVAGVEVRALRLTTSDGERRFQHGGSDRTDDRGAYRIYPLQPGDFILSASPRLDAGDSIGDAADAIEDKTPAGRISYAAVYYPGTVMADSALRVRLDLSEERNGVDFKLEFVAPVKIEGTVTSAGPRGACIPHVALVPIAAQSTAPAVAVSVAQTEGDRFSFTDVAPGQYRVMARCALPRAGGSLWEERELLVSGRDISDADLALRPGMTVSGQLRAEGAGASPRVDFSTARVMLVPRGEEFNELGREPLAARIEPGGGFTISGVPPGLYDVDATIPPGAQGTAGSRSSVRWTLDSALVNGRDALDFLLRVLPGQDVTGADLTFTTRWQELSGMLVDSSGTPATEYTVIVFSADTRFWSPGGRRIVATRPGTDGMFAIRDLPAGEYRVAAVTDVEAGEWYDPGFLKQLLAASVAVSVKPGGVTVQNLRVAR